MIQFNYLTDFSIEDEVRFISWVESIIKQYGFSISSVNYIFCDEGYLLEMNQKHLNHDSHTDIITFDYSEDLNLYVDLFISIDRIKVNAKNYKVELIHELLRIMSHGLLHCMGFDDKSIDSKKLMKEEEEKCIHLYFNQVV